MAIREGLLQELTHEAANTRRALERVPDGALDWRPHPKSMSMGMLASHLAESMAWGAQNLTTSGTDFDSETYVPPAYRTTKEVLAAFDKNLAAFKEQLAKATDAQLTATWTAKMKGKVIFALPRVAVIRSMILNHSIHHRGQLTVYLRLKNVPVPAIYGPSADEEMP